MKREHEIEGKLPSGYIKLEYLESTGTQYINTGLVPSNDLRTIGEFSFTKTPIVSNTSVFGSNTASGDYRYWLNYDSHFEIGYGNFKATTTIATAGVKNTFDFNRVENGVHNFTYNGDRYTATGTPNTSIPIILFGRIKGTTTYLADIRIYGIAFERNAEYVRMFVPALRLSDNKPGLYDLCGSVCQLTGSSFYVNAGTDEFLYN